MSDGPENLFIASLGPEEAQALRPLLNRVQVAIGEVMVAQGAPLTAVHFPIDAQFANVIRFSDGTAIETAVVGHEGLTGLAAFMANRGCAWEIVCRAGGEAYAVSVDALRTVAHAHPQVLERMLALTDLYQAQAAQTAACNALHPVTDRIARWILTACDLSPNNTLVFRQEELALLIGARRSTVSEAASRLKSRRFIAYNRGVIRITDRPGLEAAACDCYRMLKPRLDDVHRSQVGSA